MHRIPVRPPPSSTSGRHGRSRRVRPEGFHVKARRFFLHRQCVGIIRLEHARGDLGWPAHNQGSGPHVWARQCPRCARAVRRGRRRSRSSGEGRSGAEEGWRQACGRGRRRHGPHRNPRWHGQVEVACLEWRLLLGEWIFLYTSGVELLRATQWAVWTITTHDNGLSGHPDALSKAFLFQHCFFFS
jgi:hypothetical protein